MPSPLTRWRGSSKPPARTPSTLSGQTEDIVGLVDAVVRPLIEFEDDLEIQASETEDGGVLVEVRVHEEDAGKVIGRQGRVIKAIRTLARAVASRTGTPVEVELID